MSTSKRKQHESPIGGRATAVVVAGSAWLVGSASLVAFFVVFVFFGPQNWVGLGLGEWTTLVWDALLCAVFFLQHSVMVRQAYRDWLATCIPSYYQGAAYTIASAIALLLLVVFWQESPRVLVSLEGSVRWILRSIYVLSIVGFAWGMLALGSFDTFGLRPILDQLRHADTSPMPFTVRGPYRWVRHPLYTFSLAMIWAYPVLSLDRLLFATLFTAWVTVGTILEERDLVAAFGSEYRSYQRQVPMLVPWRFRAR